MEARGYRQGSESQDSDDPVPPGTTFDEHKDSPSASTPSPVMPTSSRGVENAKKRLRAFSIQKKASVPPVTVIKPVSTGTNTVLIGKLCSVKVNPKPEKPPDDDKKLPKPPKPGGSKKCFNESYSELQKKTLSEIEEMKRKMELVELGIPLGLVCPSTNAIPVKAMPTKAMPPIKTFLADSFRVLDATATSKKKKVQVKEKIVTPKKVKEKKIVKNKYEDKRSCKSKCPHNAKIDEIIREARKAKAEGKEFKFDYQKFVPDYDNPFQRKKDQDQKSEEAETVEKTEEEHRKPRSEKDRRDKDKERRKSERFNRRHDFKKDDRDKYRDKERHREKDKKEESRSKSDKSKDRDYKSRDKDDKYKKDEKSDKKDVKEDSRKDEKKEVAKKVTAKQKDKDARETDVNLNDYLVCDSWSLDTEGKNSPQVEDKLKKDTEDKSKKSISKDVPIPIDPLEQLRQSLSKGRLANTKTKVEKLKPVEDSFAFEIDPNDDEILDIFDDDTNLDKFAKKKSKNDSFYNDGMNDESFLESVINEIKQENMSEDETHDKGLVEYDESPVRDSKEPSIGSVTPDIDDSSRAQSQRSDYSDGFKSVDSRKSTESGYKSTESGYKSESKESSSKSESKCTESNFKPIDAHKLNDHNQKDRFKSTFKLTDNESKSESRSRSESQAKTSESHVKLSESQLKSSESRSKSSEDGPSQRSKGISQKQREIFSVERELDEALEAKMSKDTVNSLETWSFVLKICQPLLFRHDKNKCFKETRTAPKLWFTLNPKLCNCVTDRSIVYEELERCKMDHVDRLYGCDQIPEPANVIARTWYPQQEQCVVENAAPMQLSSEWDVDEEQTRPHHGAMDPRMSMTPGREDESLDREYQRFMEAVSWPETSQPSEGRSMTPVRQESRKTKAEDQDDRKKDAKKMKMTSEGWSQESEVEEDEKTKTAKADKVKQKQKRKRKRSPSTISSASDSEPGEKKKKKAAKKKDEKKAKSKAKRRRLEKKMLKKLKDKKKKKKAEKLQEVSYQEEEEEKVPKKKDKKVKKKKQQKVKKKSEKKKKRAKSTSTSSSESSSSSDSSSDDAIVSEKKAKKKKEVEVKKKKKKEKKKKRKRELLSSESQSEDVFDENILNNIKTERLTDDENKQDMSPVRKHREIINVKELQDDFSSNVQIKQEAVDETNKVELVQPPKESPKPIEIPTPIHVTEEEKTKENEVTQKVEEVPKKLEELPKKVEEVPKILEEIPKKAEEVPKKAKEVSKKVAEVAKEVEEVPEKIEELPKKPEEVAKKVKEVPKKVEKVDKKVEVPRKVVTEADLMNRFDLGDQYSPVEGKIEKFEFKEPEIPTPPPRVDDTSQCSSQESIQSITSAKEAAYEKDDSHLRPSCDNSNYSFNDVINSQSGYKNIEEKFEGYENYEMYEQMAMAYQSDVASQQISPPTSLGGSQRIETVVRARCGEIKCDWRASDSPAPDRTQRPSRWGLKPGEVNIVLTGGGEQTDPRLARGKQPVYKIQSLANRGDTSMGYDEAYMDTYGAADRLQYGDCFAPAPPAPAPASPAPPRASRSLDDRISQALRNTVLGEVTKDDDGDKETPEKGILVTKPVSEGRGAKRVSFADGYKPGQDSDTEEPPVRKRKRARRVGCAWPCPAAHPDHVPLWDALPPPPPPPGSPPPPRLVAPPLHLLRSQHCAPPDLPPPPDHRPHKYNPNAALPNFMPPEPPHRMIFP